MCVYVNVFKGVNVFNLYNWLDYGYGTVEKLTLSGADRRINMSLMKISYSQGARN